MRRSALIILSLFFLIKGWSQDTAYRQLLRHTEELTIGDSIHLDQLNNGVRLDSILTRKFFSPILSSGNNPFKNRIYTCLGRITNHEYYDLFLLREDRKRSDSSNLATTYLFSLKKSGEHISEQKVLVSGTKKRSGYNIQSTLYKDNRIFIDTKIITGEKVFEEAENYRISKTGRFILEEKGH